MKPNESFKWKQTGNNNIQIGKIIDGNTYTINNSNNGKIIGEHGSDSSKVNFNNTYGINANELKTLIDAIREKIPYAKLSSENTETVNDSIEIIETELVKATPKKGLLRMALTELKAFKETAEFGAVIVALIQFVQTFI